MANKLHDISEERDGVGLDLAVENNCHSSDEYHGYTSRNAQVDHRSGNRQLNSLYSLLRVADGFNAFGKSRHSLHDRIQRRPSGVRRVKSVIQGSQGTEDNSNAKQCLKEELRQHGTEDGFLGLKLRELVWAEDVDQLKEVCTYLKESNHNLCDANCLGKRCRETALATAIANNATDCAKLLMDIGGQEVICHIYNTTKYERMSCLHQAIIRQNEEVLQYMLNILSFDEKSHLFQSMANGRKGQGFLSLPLTMAIDSGHIRIIDLLLRHGADLMVTDSVTGNTVFHQLAEMGVKSPHQAVDTLCDILQSDATDHWWNSYDDNYVNCTMVDVLLRTRNVAGYTPMSYAVLLGSTEYAAAILNMKGVYTVNNSDIDQEHEQWYEVSEIDPAVFNHETNAFSVLEMFTYLPSNKNLTLGEMPQLKKIIKWKWQLYKKWLAVWFIYHLCVMLVFTVYCTQLDVPPTLLAYTQRSIDMNTTGAPTYTHGNRVFTAMELFVLLSSVIYLILDVCDIIQIIKQHCRWSIRKPGANIDFRIRTRIFIRHFDLLRLNLSCFAVSVPIMFILRLLASPWQDFFYAIAVISGWQFMLFFIRAVKKVGIFTTMVHRMIAREMIYVSILLSIGIVSYGTAFYMVFKVSGSIPDEIKTPFDIYFLMIKVILGFNEFDDLDTSRVHWLNKILLVSFILLCQILLLNVLIAAMSNTYKDLADIKDIVWRQILMKSLLTIERRLLWCRKATHGLTRLDSETLWYFGCEVTEKDQPWRKLSYDRK